jgi:hypothetical protein
MYADAIKERRNFTEHEDNLLIEAVALYGEKDWVAVSEKVPGRAPRQCKERWRHYLAPAANLKAWTQQDDALLMSLHTQFGEKWSILSSHFPGRSPNTLKNHYFTIIKKQINKDEDHCFRRCIGLAAQYRSDEKRSLPKRMEDDPVKSSWSSDYLAQWAMDSAQREKKD